jgi:hypothetical protein
MDVRILNRVKSIEYLQLSVSDSKAVIQAIPSTPPSLPVTTRW